MCEQNVDEGDGDEAPPPGAVVAQQEVISIDGLHIEMDRSLDDYTMLTQVFIEK